VIGFVAFYRGREKVFETAPIEVTEATAARLKTMPLRFTVPLDQLANGEYNCQVTILDPSGQKVAFRSSQIMVIP
jgi:hypothetical protein